MYMCTVHCAACELLYLYNNVVFDRVQIIMHAYMSGPRVESAACLDMPRVRERAR